MLYRDFDLAVVPDGIESFAVLARAPSGEAYATLSQDPSACLGLLSKDQDGSHRLSPRARESFDRERGNCLFQSLFQGDVRALFDRAHGEAKYAGEGLRIRLLFDPREDRMALLAGLPWELLYDRRTEQFLSLDVRTPVVHLYDPHHRPPLYPQNPRLQILLAGAQVERYPRLDFDEEVRRIAEVFAGRDDVVVETLRNTRRGRLVNRLQEDAFEVLHLIMHGEYDDAGQACLVFEDGYGGADPVSGTDLVRQICAGTLPRLVVLNICLSATQSVTNPMISVAIALVLAGCPVVLAMPSKVGDEAVMVFTGRFYERLARGECIEEAVVKSRLAVDVEVPPKTRLRNPPAIFLGPHAVTTLLLPRAEDGRVAASIDRSPPRGSSQQGPAFSVSASKLGSQKSIHVPAGTASIGGADDPHRTKEEKLATSIREALERRLAADAVTRECQHQLKKLHKEDLELSAAEIDPDDTSRAEKYHVRATRLEHEEFSLEEYQKRLLADANSRFRPVEMESLEKTPIHVTTVAPEAVRPGDRFIVDVVLHIAGYKVDQTEGRVIDPSVAVLPLLEGAHIAVRLVPTDANVFTVDECEGRCIWMPPYQRIDFRLRARDHLEDGLYDLRVEYWCEGVQLARNYLEIAIAATAPPQRRRRLTITRRFPESYFASYSRLDKVEVVGVIDALKARGFDVFFDCLDIQQGKNWREILQKELKTRENLLLFWSTHARSSEWVEREWRFALENHGDDHIVPNALAHV